MEFMESFEGIYRDLAVIGLELLFILTLFIIFNTLIGLIFNKVKASKLSDEKKQKAKPISPTLKKGWRKDVS